MSRKSFAEEHCWPALIAAAFAQELGLPAGNLWEPGITRNIEKYLNRGYTRDEIEDYYRLRLGLES